MGRQKLLLPWAGRTVIEHIIDELNASLVDRVRVVASDYFDELRARLQGEAVEVLMNPAADEGMLSSVRVGISEPPGDGFMVVLGDQPSLSSKLVDGLIRCWEKHPQSIVRPKYEGLHGHPVLIPSEFRKHVLERYDEMGLKGLLREFPDRVRNWEINDPGVIRDIDTPEDYAQEIARLSMESEKD